MQVGGNEKVKTHGYTEEFVFMYWLFDGNAVEKLRLFIIQRGIKQGFTQWLTRTEFMVYSWMGKIS